MFSQPYDAGPCRTATVDVCDTATEPNASIPALAVFQMPIRDELDFTVDFTAWIAANGLPNMSAATFTVASGSPKTPTIRGQGFSQTGKANIVLAAPNGSVANDAFWLDITAVFDQVPASTTSAGIPARKLVRRIMVVLVNG